MKCRALNFSLIMTVMIISMASQSRADDLSAPQASEALISVDLCMTCHGSYGQGNPVVGGPSLAGLEPWYLERQLKLFRDGLRGQQPDYIPGYEMRKTVEAMSDTQISNLTQFIANWSPTSAESTLEGDIENGRDLYSTCAVCHGAQGEGNKVLGAPGLSGRNDWYMLKQLKLFSSGYRGSHPDDTAGRQMRSMMESLQSEQDMIDVLTYVNAL